MKIALWAAGAVLLGIAALATYWAFQSPTFVAGLTALAAGAAWQAVKPMVMKPETPKARKARQAAYRRADGDGDFRRRSGAPPKG